jgi:hypothetical protein
MRGECVGLRRQREARPATALSGVSGPHPRKRCRAIACHRSPIQWLPMRGECVGVRRQREERPATALSRVSGPHPRKRCRAIAGHPARTGRIRTMEAPLLAISRNCFVTNPPERPCSVCGIWSLEPLHSARVIGFELRFSLWLGWDQIRKAPVSRGRFRVWRPMIGRVSCLCLMSPTFHLFERAQDFRGWVCTPQVHTGSGG